MAVLISCLIKQVNEQVKSSLFIVFLRDVGLFSGIKFCIATIIYNAAAELSRGCLLQ